MGMNVKEKADLRGVWYEALQNAVLAADTRVKDVEPVSDGLLFHLDNGEFVELSVVVKDAAKFDLAGVRAKYAEKMERAALRAELSRKAAEAKEAKAQEKAEKARLKAETAKEGK